MTAGMDHVVSGPDGIGVEAEASADLGRITVATNLEVGQRLEIVKFLAYGWSAARSLPGSGLRSRPPWPRRGTPAGTDSSPARRYLEDFWTGADIEVDGDPEIQQAVRFGLFHVPLSTAASRSVGGHRGVVDEPATADALDLDPAATARDLDGRTGDSAGGLDGRDSRLVEGVRRIVGR